MTEEKRGTEMINEKKAKRFCKDYTKIENYEEAVKDTTQTWHCHHILGEILTKQQLLDHNFYYDVPPCMLKFVTKAEHNRLHKKGKHLSEETRRKISAATKGEKNPLFGKHHTDETRKKMSEAHQNISEETRRKLSESHKGKPVWNKGRHLSDETKKKISEAAKNMSEEHRRKISASHKGKTWKLIDGKRVWLTKEA